MVCSYSLSFSPMWVNPQGSCLQRQTHLLIQTWLDSEEASVLAIDLQCHYTLPNVNQTDSMMLGWEDAVSLEATICLYVLVGSPEFSFAIK